MTGPDIPGLLIAAPSSNSGKTVITLALLRALRRRAIAVGAAKTGPDYIDPAFQAAACGSPCINLDPWAMSPDELRRLAADQARGKTCLLCEGVMGLFDGAANGDGSSADLAAMMGWPVVLVVDVKGQSTSAAALIAGFARFRADVRIAGVILNRVGSARHRDMIVSACKTHLPDIPIIGAVRRSADLDLPERHLGLVQAGEHPRLDGFLDRAAAIIAEDVDLDALMALADPDASAGNVSAGNASAYEACGLRPSGHSTAIAPLGRRIAVARDAAFGFAYTHILAGWNAAGAEISFFSPLADEGPAPGADAIYLPGGYPELHGATLAKARHFKAGLRSAAERNIPIYGECGGYMVLGRHLVDADGGRHEMLDLLPLETSFATRKLHLGYRAAVLMHDSPLGPAGTVLRGHEFHYASTVAADGPAFCQMTNALGAELGPAGLHRGSVFGSFFHMVSHWRAEGRETLAGRGEV